MAQKRLVYLKESFVFESAYCLYRLGKFDSSLNTICSKADSDPRFRLLRGQALYRLERFEEAAMIFQSLLENGDFPAEELQVNLLAAKSQAKLPTDSMECKSFDVSFNLALAKLLTGNFKEAEDLATDCEQFSLDENTSSSDLVNAQLVCICAMMASKENWPEAECLLRKLQINQK